MLSKINRILSTRDPVRLLLRFIGLIAGIRGTDYCDIERAIGHARTECGNRMREDGSRAFGHGVTVCLFGLICLGIRDPALIMAMILHDVVEDINGQTHLDIEREFGQNVAYFVRWLSKPHPKLFPTKESRNEFYYRTFMDAPRSVLCGKLPDVLHNLLTLFACTEEKQKRIVGVARRVYLPLAKKHAILADEIEAAILRVEEGWKKKSFWSRVSTCYRQLVRRISRIFVRTTAST